MDDLDNASPLISGAHKLYDTVTGFFNKVPTPGYNPQASDHQKAIDAVNKKLNDDRAADVMKSFTVKTSSTPASSVTTKPLPKPAPKKAIGKTY